MVLTVVYDTTGSAAMADTPHIRMTISDNSVPVNLAPISMIAADIHISELTICKIFIRFI